MLSTIAAILIVLLSTFPSGLLFAFALLRKTGINLFEAAVVGFIFGLFGPATLTWMEAYLIPVSGVFAFSVWLFELNAALLLVVALLLCLQQGVFKSFREDFMSDHVHAKKRHGVAEARPPHRWVWVVLAAIMLVTFFTRIENIVIAPTFFEFDPYFDMMDTSYILTYGQQLLLDTSAWPAIPQGTNHRIEPLVPYLEAYWYELSNDIGPHFTSINTAMLSDVSSVYPPIAAALLVFAIFFLIYHEYNEYVALIAAGLTASMPVLLTTFIAGEQLVEPWGIFALFFFFGAYMLAIKNPKSVRLAVFAGLAFALNFLGAHYYTVTTGVVVIYIVLQGVIDVLRNETSDDFYKMNGIMIAVIAIFYLIYLPYSSTLQNRIPNVLGVPLTLSGLVLALVFVAVMDYGFKLLHRKRVFKDQGTVNRVIWMAVIAVIAVLVLVFTPLGNPVKGYLALSQKFTTPSSPLFMTVEEYVPTGLSYNFGSQGFGIIGADLFGQPILVWLVCAVALLLLALSIYSRRSRTGVLYMAIAIPLMIAGFSEVKYLPHFGVAYVMLFVVIIGELIYYSENGLRLPMFKKPEENVTGGGEIIPADAKVPRGYAYLIPIILSIGLFFLSSVLAMAYIAYLLLNNMFKENSTYLWVLLALMIAVVVLSAVLGYGLMYGESGALIDALHGAAVVYSSPSITSACNTVSRSGDSLTYTLFCNTIPQYWLAAMSWINQNVGPHNTRVLAWWDYGDWINWFGNSNAFLRGDNANATEDYATAAQYVLTPSEGVNPSTLATFMNTNQSKYVLFDQDLIGKWGALDFLACIYSKGTTQQFAEAAGAAQNPPQPYALGSSSCEQAHDPQYALLPYGLLIGNQSLVPPTLSIYCQITNSTGATGEYVEAPLQNGSSISNKTACVNIAPLLQTTAQSNFNGVLNVYNQTGSKMNAVVQLSYAVGLVTLNVGGYSVPYVQFLMVYLPNGPNGTITDAPTGFYQSNYYKGFFLGKLPGFTQVYPNATDNGINLVNGSYPVRIFELNNFTGTLPSVLPKPAYMHNNYTIPG